jgi:hypothetical protein
MIGEDFVAADCFDVVAVRNVNEMLGSQFETGAINCLDLHKFSLSIRHSVNKRNHW